METTSPFTGTPWTSEDEIYDYVSNMRYVEAFDWDYIKDCLVDGGLESSYADAIIANMQDKTGENSEDNAWKGTAKIILAILVFCLGFWLVTSNINFHMRGRGYFLWIFGSGYLLVDGIRDLMD